MPIYDFNGTTKQEIGKLFDYDGTTTHQIGKVYDNNGSANSLVYTSGLIFPGTAPTQLDSSQTSSESNKYIGTADEWYIYIANGTNRNSIVGSIEIDVTSVSTIHIEGSFSWSTLCRWLLVSDSQLSNDRNTLKYPYYYVATDRSGMYTKKGNSLPADIDVSALKGVYHILMGAYTNGNGNVSASITKIEVEE